MWYPLPLFATEVEIQLEGEQARVWVQVKTTNKTGLGWKLSPSKAMVIESIKLMKKKMGNQLTTTPKQARFNFFI